MEDNNNKDNNNNNYRSLGDRDGRLTPEQFGWIAGSGPLFRSNLAPKPRSFAAAGPLR